MVSFKFTHAKLAKRALYACCVDLQKGYATVTAFSMTFCGAACARLDCHMLVAIQSLHASGALAVKIDGTPS